MGRGGAYSQDELDNLREEMNEDATDQEVLVEDEMEDEEDEDEDEEPWYDDDEDVYGPDGEVVFSPAYDRMLVDRKCKGCCCIFRGMPDHAYCGRCADIIERGGEYPVCEEAEQQADEEESMEDFLERKAANTPEPW